ncbi:MAG TPA: hypothetical protein VG756_26060 [Pseudonocardiaceae bacterium]|jgi:endogenous inhibitor of DNA gyrase (YacG/DUF329 family)|nr:hypothetical protein [Pseudonocardiaceae bacterium]
MVIATRFCAACGTTFTWTNRNPNRRFCDPRCKARWWRSHNQREHAGLATADEAGTVPAGDDLERASAPVLSAHACPHCGHAINVIELLLAGEDAPA